MIRIALILTLIAAPVGAQTPSYPDAAASDPVALGWMQGSPPSPERIIRVEGDNLWRFPQLRWSFSHWRELHPTVAVPRGRGPASRLPRAERADLDDVTFMPIGGATPMTWKASLAANYTDGIVVLHKGRVVYERYFGALKPDGQHLAMSVTKSFFGTMAATLIAEGKLDADAPVARYIPELAQTGFADATVRQVLDMTTGIAYDESYTNPKSAFLPYARSANFNARPPGYTGPNAVYDYVTTIAKDGEHGRRFIYKSPNSDVIGWLIRRVTGKPAEVILSEGIWSRLGAEQDAYLHVDPAGTAFAAGGLNLGLRDLARFGEMMRLGGRYNGQQIIPAAAVAAIAKGGDPERFNKPAYPTLPGGSYANQWWFTHNEHGAYIARGIHGQAIYIDPKAEMVIARFASHPNAANVGIDPTSLPAYHALARHLMAKRR